MWVRSNNWAVKIETKEVACLWTSPNSKHWAMSDSATAEELLADGEWYDVEWPLSEALDILSFRGNPNHTLSQAQLVWLEIKDEFEEDAWFDLF